MPGVISGLRAPTSNAKPEAEVKPQEQFALDHILVKYNKLPVNLASEHRRVFPGEGKHLKYDPRTPQGRLPDLTNTYAVKVEPGLTVAKMVEKYRRDPNVEYAEPDGVCYAAATTAWPPSFTQALIPSELRCFILRRSSTRPMAPKPTIDPRAIQT